MNTSLSVPLCDIQAQYRALESELEDAVSRVLKSGQVIMGPEVAGLEEEAESRITLTRVIERLENLAGPGPQPASAPQ